jgi:hypothetical protein
VAFHLVTPAREHSTVRFCHASRFGLENAQAGIRIIRAVRALPLRPNRDMVKRRLPAGSPPQALQASMRAPPG